MNKQIGKGKEGKKEKHTIKTRSCVSELCKAPKQAFPGSLDPPYRLLFSFAYLLQLRLTKRKLLSVERSSLHIRDFKSQMLKLYSDLVELLFLS